MLKASNKIQKGGVLLEAMAVLGLMTVATPIVYKKAVEKSKEIEDVTVASQMRTIRDAASVYIEKNYETVQDGATLQLKDLRQYLPPNFMANMSKSLVDYNSNLTPEESANEAVKIVVRKNTETTETNGLPIKRASAYVITNKVVGSGTVDEKRGNYIASLIGSEGGYITDNKIMGSNNAWEQDLESLNKGLDADRPIVSGDDLTEGHIVASTTFTKDPLSGDFLYRNSVEGFPQFNMMMTNLDINGNSINRVRNLGFKYNKDEVKRDSIRFEGESGSIIGTNAAGENGIKTVEIKARDSGSLKLTANNGKGCSSAESDYDGTGAGGLSGCNRAGVETVALTASHDGGQHGMLSTRSAESDSEALAYGTSDNGGAFEVRGNNGAARGILIGSESETYGEFTDTASKLTLNGSDGLTRSYAGATASGGRMLFGNGDISSTYNQTILADAESSMVAARNDRNGYAAIRGRYKSNPGYSSNDETETAALLVATDKGKFALDNNAVGAVLSTHNNSGYMRLNRGASEKLKISAIHFNETISGGALYLKGNNPSDNVIMESNRNGTGAGYAEFKSDSGYSTVTTGDNNAVFTAYAGDKDNAVLSAANANGNGGLLSLKNNGTEYASLSARQNDANNGSLLNLTGEKATIRIGARTSNDNPRVQMDDSGKNRVDMYSGGGQDSDSSAMKLTNNDDKTTVKVYAYKTADEEYGTTGTINISDGGKGGVDIHGKLKSKENVFGSKTADGGVIVAKKTDGSATGWLAGNGNNNAGVASLSTTSNGFANRVDLYASGGKDDDMGGTGHVIDGGGREGASMYAKFDGTYQPMNAEIKIANRGEYKGYAVTEVDDVTAKAVNSTDVYVKGADASGGIVVNEKLYTNVLCINLPNKDEKIGDDGVIDSFGDASIAKTVNDQLDSKGDKKCVALSPNAQWKNIIYEVVASYTNSGYGDSNPLYGGQKPKIATYKYAGVERALRGHEHTGFAKYGHDHDSYVSTDMHHDSKKGKAKWNEDNSYLVGDYCTELAKYEHSIYCCSDIKRKCLNDETEGSCTGAYYCSGGTTPFTSGNGVEHCCKKQDVYDQRNSYWSSEGV